MTSHRLSGGVIGWRQLLPSTNCMIMRLFSRHCRMMWPVWRHKVASCFILLSFPSGVTYDPRSAVRASHLRPECHQLRIIVRSRLFARAWLTNKPIYPFIPGKICPVSILQRSVACMQQRIDHTWSAVLCGSFLWHIRLVFVSVIHCSSIRMICAVRQITPDAPCHAYPLHHGFVTALQIGSAFSKCLDTIFHRCEIVQTSPVFCGCSVLNHLTPNEITVCMVSGVLLWFLVVCSWLTRQFLGVC